jgi:putative ABC transport system permease protein
MPDRRRRFIAVVSRLAPRASRREFRAEWEAELAIDPSMRRAVGAVPDAWFLFRQQWSADMLLQDVRYAIRLMRQRPGFTAAIVLTLALGIGANTAVFTVINGVLLRPLPYQDPNALMAIWENDRLNARPRYPVAPANFKDWQDQSQTFERVSAFVENSMTFTNNGEGIRAPSAVVSINLFETLGSRPLLGDGFTAEHVSGRQRVLILSYDAWQRHFRGDPAIVGRQIDAGAPTPYRIVGVMPQGFHFPSRETAVWRPLVFDGRTQANRAVHFLSVVGRRRPGVTVQQAQADLDSIALSQQQRFPETNDQRGVTLVPLTDQIVGDVQRPLYVLGGAVLIVLLIGCANVGNLMMIRAASRRRELAVRAALGADRMRIARQLLAEGLALSGAGALAGLALAWWGTRVLGAAAAPYVPRISDASIDWRVLAFLAAVAMVCGVTFALVPLMTSRGSNLRNGLQENSRTAGPGPAGRRVRGALAIGEIAIACVLVLGAGLGLKSFWRLIQVSPGFATDQVLSGVIELPAARYAGTPHVTAFYRTLLDRLRQAPGVQAVGVINALPMTGSGPTTWLTLEGAPRAAGEPPEVNYRSASPDLFRALEVPVLAGRAFDEQDTAASMQTVLVNRTLADRFFPGVDPIGRRIRIGPNPQAAWRTIVGVVGDMRQAGPDLPAAPELYLPATQDGFSNLSVAIRTAGDPLALASTFRDVVRTIDPQLAIVNIRTMEQIVSRRVASRRLLMILVALFAAVALTLALIGIYGVMANTVSQRTNEIGVRMALGAQRSTILGMVLRDGAALGLTGVGLGVAMALAGGRFVESAFYGVTPTDAATYAIVITLMLLVGLVACYVPARRAARVDPLRAIRAD